MEQRGNQDTFCQGCMDNRLTQKLKKMQKLMMMVYYGRDKGRFCGGKDYGKEGTGD